MAWVRWVWVERASEVAGMWYLRAFVGNLLGDILMALGLVTVLTVFFLLYLSLRPYRRPSARIRVRIRSSPRYDVRVWNNAPADMPLDAYLGQPAGMCDAERPDVHQCVATHIISALHIPAYQSWLLK